MKPDRFSLHKRGENRNQPHLGFLRALRTDLV